VEGTNRRNEVASFKKDWFSFSQARGQAFVVYSSLTAASFSDD
jgi:hypothetical protein